MRKHSFHKNALNAVLVHFQMQVSTTIRRIRMSASRILRASKWMSSTVMKRNYSNTLSLTTSFACVDFALIKTNCLQVCWFDVSSAVGHALERTSVPLSVQVLGYKCAIEGQGQFH